MRRSRIARIKELEAVDVIDLAEVRRRAYDTCPCDAPNCALLFPSGCGNGETEVSYTPADRILRIDCLGCEQSVARIELPPAEGEPNRRDPPGVYSLARLNAARCQCCEKPNPEHPVVLQQRCHPRKGKIVMFLRNLNCFHLVCAVCEHIVGRIDVGPARPLDA